MTSSAGPLNKAHTLRRDAAVALQLGQLDIAAMLLLSR
jgi:hypothetical protein